MCMLLLQQTETFWQSLKGNMQFSRPLLLLCHSHTAWEALLITFIVEICQCTSCIIHMPALIPKFPAPIKYAAYMNATFPQFYILHLYSYYHTTFAVCLFCHLNASTDPFTETEYSMVKFCTSSTSLMEDTTVLNFADDGQNQYATE